MAPVVHPEAEELAINLDPEAAVREEAQALGAGLAVPGAERQALDRVDVLLGEVVPAGARGEGAATEVVDELVALRVRALTVAEPLPEGYRGEFIGMVAPGAVAADVRFGVPASITIAQAIIESGWGKTAPGYNLFGMKGEGPAGSLRRSVVEYRHGHRGHRTASLRLYHDVGESLADHARVLATANCYAEARKVEEDPAAYARALVGHYATDPHYASKLIDIAQRYDLGRFDWVRPPPSVPLVAAAE